MLWLGIIGLLGVAAFLGYAGLWLSGLSLGAYQIIKFYRMMEGKSIPKTKELLRTWNLIGETNKTHKLAKAVIEGRLDDLLPLLEEVPPQTKEEVLREMRRHYCPTG
jgi:hypothetical protein